MYPHKKPYEPIETPQIVFQKYSPGGFFKPSVDFSLLGYMGRKHALPENGHNYTYNIVVYHIQSEFTRGNRRICGINCWLLMCYVVAATKNIVSLRTSPQTGVAIPYGGPQQSLSTVVSEIWRRLPRRVSLAPPPRNDILLDAKKDPLLRGSPKTLCFNQPAIKPCQRSPGR